MIRAHERRGLWPRQRVQAERSRLTLAILVSLLIHTLLLSLTFGGAGLGLPGFDFPWRARRTEVPDLRVFLVPAQVTAAEPASTPIKEPLEQASIKPPVAGAPVPPPPLSLASPIPPTPPAPGLTAVVIAPEAMPTEQSKATTETNTVARTKLAAEAKLESATANDTVPANAPLRTEAAVDAAPTSIPTPTVIAVERTNEPTFVVPPAPAAPVVAAPSDSSAENTQQTATRQEAARAEAAKREVARQEAARVEAARVEADSQEAARESAQKELQRQANARDEAARVEAVRQEAAQRESQRREATRMAAAKLETQRQAMAREEAARIVTAKMEAARLEAQRQEASRIEAARVAAAQLEAQRLESARQAAARAETARVESVRLENERIEAARQAAASKEAARLLAEKEEDARRLSRRLAMGRQLNEEAARREAAEIAARAPSTLPYSYSTARRARLWGRTDANVELAQYAEAWARRIQFNTSVETVRDVAKRPHINPMVTVAIRSDGTVESVTFVVSSGAAEVDEAIRRIVQNVAPNPAFPPGLASEYDVIEVRRTWSFDVAVRLH